MQESAYQYIWNNYKIFAQKYYNSTTLSMWVVHAKCVSKNSIASQDVFFSYFDITWYAEASFLSFYSFLLNFVE